MEIVLLVLIVLIVFFVVVAKSGKSKNPAEEQQKTSSYQDYRKTRAEENLRIILANSYQKQKVCNRLERMAYLAAFGIVLERQRKEHVLAQVCLGEFLRHPDKRAHSATASGWRYSFAMMISCRWRPSRLTAAATTCLDWPTSMMEARSMPCAEPM